MTDLQALWKYQESILALDEFKRKIRQSEAHKRYGKLHKQLTVLLDKKETLERLIKENAVKLKKFEEEAKELDHKYDLEAADIQIMANDEEVTAIEASEAVKSIEALLSSIKRLKANVMRILDKLTKLQSQLEEVLLQGGRAKKEYDTVREQCIEEEQSQLDEMNRLQNVISEREKEVSDSALKKRFEAIRRFHADPIAPVSNNKCSGCQMGLPTALVHKVMVNHELLECENCGRLLCCETDVGDEA